jgi:hypothetical protein
MAMRGLDSCQPAVALSQSIFKEANALYANTTRNEDYSFYCLGIHAGRRPYEAAADTNRKLSADYALLGLP